MKVTSVIGARPQFIKLAPLSKALRQRCRESVVHTGQHYDYEMSGTFFKELGISEPEIDLGVGSSDSATQTAHILERLAGYLAAEKPDAVIVYGDTNSTLAGTLAAVQLDIPLVHVEAGLRSYDRRMPEEVNRVVADHLAGLLICPTQGALENLAKEGTAEKAVVLGDIMVQSLMENREESRRHSSIVSQLGLREKEYALFTLHRAGNTDDRHRLERIIDAIIESGRKTVFPAHPRTLRALVDSGLISRVERAKDLLLSEPLGYLDFLALESSAELILTDSGGVQKEAYVLGIPCVTLRAETEWTETVQAGWNKLVDADARAIIDALEHFRPTGPRPELYGSGDIAGHMASKIISWVGSL